MDSNDEQTFRIAEAYRAGHRIADIEDEFGVSRSTVAEALSKTGALIERSKRPENVPSQTQALGSMFELLQNQERHVRRLEALLESHDIPVPELTDDAFLDEIFEEIIEGLNDLGGSPPHS